MSVFSLSEIEEKEIMPGFHGKMIHSDKMTFAYWNIDKNASLPEHSHPHEQVVNVLEGTFELIVAGTPHPLSPGQVFVIPSHVPHAGRAITDCRILDVFQPVREEYR